MAIACQIGICPAACMLYGVKFSQIRDDYLSETKKPR